MLLPPIKRSDFVAWAKYLDLDQDGDLTNIDKQARGAAQIFAIYDTNNDGKIDETEINRSNVSIRSLSAGNILCTYALATQNSSPDHYGFKKPVAKSVAEKGYTSSDTLAAIRKNQRESAAGFIAGMLNKAILSLSNNLKQNPNNEQLKQNLITLRKRHASIVSVLNSSHALNEGDFKWLTGLSGTSAQAISFATDQYQSLVTSLNSPLPAQASAALSALAVKLDAQPKSLVMLGETHNSPHSAKVASDLIAELSANDTPAQAFMIEMDHRYQAEWDNIVYRYNTASLRGVKLERALYAWVSQHFRPITASGQNYIASNSFSFMRMGGGTRGVYAIEMFKTLLQTQTPVLCWDDRDPTDNMTRDQKFLEVLKGYDPGKGPVISLSGVAHVGTKPFIKNKALDIEGKSAATLVKESDSGFAVLAYALRPLDQKYFGIDAIVPGLPEATW